MKKMICLVFCGVVLASFNVRAQKNLLYNGGFENELEGWNAGNAKVTPWMSKSGKAGLAIINFNKDKWEEIDQAVNLPKNTQAIKVSGWVKTDQVEQGKEPWNAALIIVEFTNGTKKIGEGLNVLQQSGSKDWTKVSKVFKVPADAKGVRIMVALGNASGTFFADELMINTLTLEDFEQAAAAQN
jgi:hypothetical protein